jgi:two-component system response regulator YesN
VKILIADDEGLVRFSLKSMLEEIGIPPRAIHAASDGEEMVDVARRVEPDLAFVDIKMPRLDGLSGIERARVLSPGTRWVILTSHSSFEFARRAISLGVIGYLLKPVRPSELQEILGRVGHEIRSDIARLNGGFESRVSSLLHETLSLESDASEFPSNARYLGAVLFFDTTLDERQLEDRQRKSCAEIRARREPALEKNTRIALVTLPVGHIAIVCAWMPGGDDTHAVETLRGFLHRIQTVLDSEGNPTTRVTQLVCGECDSLEQLLGQFTRATELSAFRALLGVGRQIGLAECETTNGRLQWGVLAAALEGLAQSYRDRNRLAYLRHLETSALLFQSMENADRDDTRSAVERFLTAGVGYPGGARPGDADWLAPMRDIGERLNAEEGRGGELVAQVMDFVYANYMRDIGIGQIANHLGVTPNYLSSLFHREKGVTFVKHLTRLRMEKAQEMLCAPGARVHDVARAVGYASVRHFSRLFQKQYGVYPSEAIRVEKIAPES